MKTQLRHGTSPPGDLDRDQMFIQHASDSARILGIWAGSKNDHRKCVTPLAVQHPGDGNDYAMKAQDSYVGADTSSGTATITTPPTDDIPDGHKITIDDEGGNANGNNITVDTPGDEHIEGSDTLTISTNDATTVLQWDKANTNWVQVA